MRQSNSTLIYSGQSFIRSAATLSLLLLTSLSGFANDTAGENATLQEAATPSSAPSIVERSPLPSQQIEMISLAAALDPSEVIWLNDKAAAIKEDKEEIEGIEVIEAIEAIEGAAEESKKTASNEKEQQGEAQFIGLYRPALQPAQMAVILMPDSIHKLAQNSLMRQLYTELPMTGWSTLHIGLPDISGATEDANTAEDKNEILAASRMATSIQFLFDKGIQSTALVAENYSVQRAISAAITQADATSGLVLWRVEKKQLPLSQLKALAESQITVLDVVNHDISAAEKAERMRKFHLAGFSQNYRLITSPQGKAGIKHTQRRVRDWLETRFKKF